jgi:hypothetical protein
MKNKLISLTLSAFLSICTGCAEPKQPPIQGTIVSVYNEIRIGESDGTTIVKTDAGEIYKYNGKLGKMGDRITLHNKGVLK